MALDQGGGFGDVVAAAVGEGFAKWGFFALSGEGGELLVEGFHENWRTEVRRKLKLAPPTLQKLGEGFLAFFEFA